MDKKEIGEAIRNFRRKNNLTQQQLAAKLFTTNITIMRWETGKTAPYRSAIEAMKILKILPSDA